MTTLIGTGLGSSTANVATLNSENIAISGSRKYLRVMAFAGDGSNQTLPTSVVWDPTGANQALTLVTGQDTGTFDSFWRAAIYELIAPSDATAAVRVTWPQTREECFVVAAAWTDVNQTTPTRTPPTLASGTNLTPTLNVTSVAADIVTAFFAYADLGANSNTLTSSTVTLRENVTTPNEIAAYGDTTAAGTSTTVSGTIASVDSGSDAWRLFGAALISDTGGGGGSGLDIPRNQRALQAVKRAANW